MFDEPPFIVRGEGIGLDEPLSETDDTRLETLAKRQVRCGAEGYFDASAADVNDDGRAASNVDPVTGCQMNQAGFLGAGNDLDPDTRLSPILGNEVAAVLGFPGGTGCRRDNLVNLIRHSQPLEFGER